MTTNDDLKQAFLALGLDEARATVAANGRRSAGLEDNTPGKIRLTAYTRFTHRPVAILEAADRIDAELWAYRNPGIVPGFAGDLVEAEDVPGLPVYQCPRQAASPHITMPPITGGRGEYVAIEEVTRLPKLPTRKGWGR